MQKSIPLGLAAAFAGVLIGVGWQLSTRAALIGALAPADLLLIRYCVPAIILAPLLWRKGFAPQGISPKNLTAAIAFGGLFYGLFAIFGAQYAPVAHMGALIPGTTPLFVAILIWCIYAQRPSGLTLLGLGVLLAGVLLVASDGQLKFDAQYIRGDALFLSAALVWAAYTVALRNQSVSIWHLCAVISFWSALGAALLWSVTPGTRLHSVSPIVLGGVGLIQGVLAGIFGNVFFLISVKHLGPIVAAGSGALVPALTALGGYLFLGEPLSGPGIVGILAIAFGMWIVQVWARKPL